MLGSAAFRTGITPGGALAGPWVRNPLWTLARAVPSLDLRFADNKSLVDATTGASLVTFTRASTGTYVGSDGVLQTAVTNLLLRSEEFENATNWIIQGITVNANSTTAPNGLSTADKLEETSLAAFFHRAVQLSGNLRMDQLISVSVYVKPVERTKIRINLFNDFNTNNFIRCDYDLTALTTTTGRGGTSSTTIDRSITPVGDGWYRLALTGIPDTGDTTPRAANLQFNMMVGGSDVYNGEVGKGMFIWGAQVEQSSTVGEYIPTTSVINSAPRFDHNPTTGESLGLLVEEARTNLLLNSATLSTQSVTVAAAANTLSFYGTGTVTLTGVSTAGPLVGTGANNRVSLTFTPTVGVLVLTVSGSVTNAQLETGAFPTSYIPTTSATATRAADVASITGTNFSSWYNQTEGVMFASWSSFAPATQRYIIDVEQAASANDRIDVNINTSNTVNPRTVVGGSAIASLSAGTYTANTAGNISFSYKIADYGSSFNGAIPVTANTAGSLPSSPARLFIGSLTGTNYLNGTIKRLTYWPTRLSNPTLQSITQ